MITASSLSRLLNCPGSSVLARAENVSAWADAGHEEHLELADQLLAGTLPEWIAAAIPDGSRSEVALAFDVSTRLGRIIGENIGRAYSGVGPYEIVGSCDTVGIEGDAVVVTDFKTGHNDVELAATNPQLAFYCLAAARALGKSRAIARIIYTKSRRIDEAELDTFDLAAFADRLERLHVRQAEMLAAKTRGDEISTREGAWCRYCPSVPYCGSKVALIKQMAGMTVIGDAVTPAVAASAYEQIVRVEQLVRDARKRLETYVDEQGPIDLGGGRMFGRYVREGNERLSGDVAVTAIAAVVGESAKEFEKVAIERKTTKAAIERAAKAVGAKRGTAAAVVKKIRELGGASHAADSMPVGEYVRDRNEPAELPQVDVAEVNRLLESA
jgi:hypothetical protein